MAYAASAAMNFRQPPATGYPQQTNPYPSAQPQQQAYNQPRQPAYDPVPAPVATSNQYSQPPTVCITFIYFTLGVLQQKSYSRFLANLL